MPHWSPVIVFCKKKCEKGAARDFIPAKLLPSSISSFFVKRIPPPPLIFFSYTAQSNIASGHYSCFFFFPSVFLDDTMQGISGRKVRLEGGETLQSSLVTMRWFSYRSSRITLFFVSWTFSCFLLHHMFFSPPWAVTRPFLISYVFIFTCGGRLDESADDMNTDAFLSCLSLLC